MNKDDFDKVNSLIERIKDIEKVLFEFRGPKLVIGMAMLYRPGDYDTGPNEPSLSVESTTVVANELGHLIGPLEACILDELKTKRDNLRIEVKGYIPDYSIDDQ